MAIDRRTNFTAMTASIKFDEFNIGGLQEISISEGWNLKPVNALGNRSPVAFIPGFFTGEVTARRAFIEKEQLNHIFTHHLRPMLSSGKMNDLVLGDVTVDSSKAIDISLIRNDTQLSKLLASFEDKLEVWEDLFYTLYFNISIKDEQDREIMLIRDCVLESKRTSMSQTGIIIMEDINFKFATIQKKI